MTFPAVAFLHTFRSIFFIQLKACYLHTTVVIEPVIGCFCVQPGHGDTFTCWVSVRTLAWG